MENYFLPENVVNAVERFPRALQFYLFLWKKMDNIDHELQPHFQGILTPLRLDIT